MDYMVLTYLNQVIKPVIFAGKTYAQYLPESLRKKFVIPIKESGPIYSFFIYTNNNNDIPS
jgi:hypothetical protein